MAARLPIPALDTPGITLNFDRLREAGIAHIANLSSQLWTDYNAHDPGITILEVLSYGITDLGFRTDFLLRDLLAPADPKDTRKQFFTAEEILPCNPVSPNDLRKILIDIPEIKNAWFFANRESKVCCEHFFAYDEKRILEIAEQADFIFEQYIPHDADGNVTSPNSYDSLQELYTAVPEFNTPDRAQLTDILVSFRQEQYWLDRGGPLFRIFILFLSVIEKGEWPDFKPSCLLDDVLQQIGLLESEFNNDTISGAAEIDQHRDLVTQYFIDWQLTIKESEMPIAGAQIMNGLYHVLVELQDDLDSENQLITTRIERKARRQLHRYRNLAEDTETVEFIGLKEILLDTVIEVEPQVDQNAIKAQIVFAIQRYLNPPLRFYSLQEMLARGRQVEEIFQTVTLDHGFLDEGELEQSKLRRVIFHSDLYRVIMSVPGVKAVKCLSLDFCRDDDKIITDEEAKTDQDKLDEARLYHNDWCFDICRREQYYSDKDYWDDHPAQEKEAYKTTIACTYKPVLPLACVDMKIEKEGTLVIIDEEEVSEKLELIQLLTQQGDVGPDRDLRVPAGRYRDLHQYFSIQNDFPQVYMVGEGELRPTASPQRKAEVHQLKAYLNFFDQLLANYAASLSQVKDVLAVEQEPEDRVLFYQSLRNIVPDFEHYLVAFYLVNQALLDALIADDDYPEAVALLLADMLHREPLAEEDFLAEVSQLLADFWTIDLRELILEHSRLERQYEQTMARLLEGSSRNFALRNEILDHLIARFGESFTDYVLSIIQSKEFDACKSPRVQLRRDLIACKTDFLRHIPVLGRDRGKGFDLLAPDCSDPLQFWDSDNVSGLKKRVSKLLCLPSTTATRTKLSCDPEIVVGKNVDIDGKSFTWAVVHEKDTIQVKGKTKKPRIQVQKDAVIYLEGVKTYSRSAKAEKDRLQIYNAMLDGNLFLKEGDLDQFLVVRKRKGTDFYELVLRNERGVALARSPESLASKRKSDLEDRRRELMALVFRPSCGDGGFHLLEHILLRPFSEDIPLLEKFCVPDEHLANAKDNCQKTEGEERSPEEGNSETEGPCGSCLGGCCLVRDPYSFWITVIAPDTWQRFPSGGARRLFQQVVRRETPAHIAIRFCWLDPQQLFRFEELYKNWLYDEGRRQSDECQIEESLSALIHFMNELADCKAATTETA